MLPLLGTGILFLIADILGDEETVVNALPHLELQRGNGAFTSSALPP
jgi:hypothetical protein